MGIAQVNGRWMMLCNRGCGWNTTHTTHFHNKWKSNSSTFVLPPSHPFHLKSSASGGGGGVTPAPAPPVPEVHPPTGSPVSSSLGSLSLDCDAIKSALEHEIRTTPSTEVAAALEAIANVLHLN